MLPWQARSSSRSQLAPIDAAAGNQAAVQEAMRETARDCVRREQLARLQAQACVLPALMRSDP